MVDGAIKRREHYRWSSDGAKQKAVFTSEGSVVESVEVQLTSLTVTLAKDPGEAPDIVVTFSVDPETYASIEGKRWFGIPVGFADWKLGGFAPKRPIEVTARYRRSGAFFPLTIVTEGTPNEELLDKLLLPLVDGAAWGPTRNPLNYEATRVWQGGDDGVGVGFDEATIAEFETGKPNTR